MSTLTYAQLVEELFPRLTGGIRWGLERTERLLASVDNPHLKYPVIHVGGTNGKGSVSATCASILRAHGLRVGLYSSPHLCTFRERVQVDGEAISESALVAAAERLWPAIKAEAPSFFEATTAIGFLALADAAVDIAVIEVGLGGRLDSTNVVSPLVTVLTNVSLDHVQLLGNTVEAVATEKAGILKRDVPAVTGESIGVAADVFRMQAAHVGAPLHQVPPGDESVRVTDMDLSGTRFDLYATSGDPHAYASLRTPLIGHHQAWNAAIAIRALELLPPLLRPSPLAVGAGLAAVRWPGRMQVEDVGECTWMFDVAHNVAGVHALLASLDNIEMRGPRVALIGVLGDKDWGGMLAPLQRWADVMILTEPPTSPVDRRWDIAAVAATLEGAGPDGSPGSARSGRHTGEIRTIADFTDAMHVAMKTAAAGTILVTGSFHTVGDALIMLGRAPFGSDVALPRIDFSG